MLFSIESLVNKQNSAMQKKKKKVRMEETAELSEGETQKNHLDLLNWNTPKLHQWH